MDTNSEISPLLPSHHNPIEITLKGKLTIIYNLFF